MTSGGQAVQSPTGAQTYVVLFEDAEAELDVDEEEGVSLPDEVVSLASEEPFKPSRVIIFSLELDQSGHSPSYPITFLPSVLPSPRMKGAPASSVSGRQSRGLSEKHAAGEASVEKKNSERVTASFDGR